MQRTPRIELRTCGPDAAALLPGWLSTSDELFAWAGARFRHPLDEAQLEEHLARTAASGSGALAFTAVAPVSGEVLGHGELTAVDAVHGTTVMRRVVVAPSQRRRGVGAALVMQLLRAAFDDLGLHRVEVRAFTHNLAAVTLYCSVGFSVEGRIREYRVHDGLRQSSYLMGMLEDEWRAPGGLASSAGGATPAAIA